MGVMLVKQRVVDVDRWAKWFWDPELSGGGALLDMGCHCVEAARYFIGKENPVVEVMAWGDTLLHDTTAEDKASAQSARVYEASATLADARERCGAVGFPDGVWIAPTPIENPYSGAAVR